MSRFTARSKAMFWRRSSQFIGSRSRSAPKPACISAQMARARARARASRGEIPRSGNFSARYSTIARLSQTTKSPSTSTGTWPTAETARTRALKSGSLNESFSSSKGIWSCVSSSQGRIDHDE